MAILVHVWIRVIRDVIMRGIVWSRSVGGLVVALVVVGKESIVGLGLSSFINASDMMSFSCNSLNEIGFSRAQTAIMMSFT